MNGDLRLLRSDDDHDLYFLPDIIRVMTSKGGEVEAVGNVARMWRISWPILS